MSDVMMIIVEAKKQINSTNVLERHIGHHVFSVAQAAHKVGLELRWPDPPFQQEHIDVLDAEWRFQLSWTLKLLNEQAKLFLNERVEYPLPEQPYTEEGVRQYVSELRSALSRRSFFARFRSPEPLSPQEDLLRTRCIQILRGNWVTSQILEEASWQMVRVPSGNYIQGCDNSVFENERPAHKSQVSAFWLGGTQVSQCLWNTVMGVESHRDSDAHPVVGISWLEAIRFCNVLSQRCGLDPVYELPDGQLDKPDGVRWTYSKNGYRLPTECEWEFAARATARGLNQMPKGVDIEHMEDYPVAESDVSDMTYSGSNLIKEVGWFVDNSHERLPMMAKKRPNSFGLYDMSGGVREWCMDGFGMYHDKEDQKNRVHHLAYRKRVCRGGAYTLREQLCRVVARSGFDFDAGNQITGLRVARTIISSDD